jgi:uncharacterized membrane protein (Fun14 family)
MLGLITYSVILLGLLLGVLRRPAIGIAAVLCLFGLKQWGQSTTQILSDYRQFTNFAVGLIALLGVAIAARKRSCVFCSLPPTAALIAVLYFYAFVTIAWSPDQPTSLDQWVIQGPYIITIALIAPLLFTDLDDVRIGFMWTAIAGATICILALVFGNWGLRGLVLYGLDARQENEVNALAISSMAGTVFLIAGLSLSRPNRKFMRLLALAFIPVALAVVLRSGSRGQLIAGVVGLLVGLPIAYRLRNAKSLIALLLIGGVVLSLGWWATSLVHVDVDRWSDTRTSADVFGRLENAVILLRAASSHPFTLVFGLGNSSAFPILGIYPHVAGLEVLGEEGFVGAVIYLAIIYCTVRSVIRITGQPDLSDSRRNALAVLAGLFVFELVLSWKQGSLLSSYYVFAYAITLARMEAPVGVAKSRPVAELVNASVHLPRFQNLMR